MQWIKNLLIHACILTIIATIKLKLLCTVLSTDVQIVVILFYAITYIFHFNLKKSFVSIIFQQNFYVTYTRFPMKLKRPFAELLLIFCTNAELFWINISLRNRLNFSFFIIFNNLILLYSIIFHIIKLI